MRPEVSGDALGGLWGLPAASLREGETPDDAVARVLRDKLGLGTLDGIKPINEGRHDQDGYTQTMTVYAVYVGCASSRRPLNPARASCGSDGDDVSGLAVGCA